MTHPASSRRRYLCFLLFLVVTLPASAQPTPQQIVSGIDKFFGSIEKSKRETISSTLQNWALIHEAFRLLDSVAVDAATPRKWAWEARYVHGYGLYVIDLYDLAAEFQTGLLADAPDERSEAKAMADLAQSLEAAGEFRRAAEIRQRRLTKVDRPSSLDLGNAALAMLKAGWFDKTIEYVDRIDIDEETAYTRIFSARAHGYAGRYDKAAAELKRACDGGEKDACDLAARLAAAKSPAAFWGADRETSLRRWQPSNFFDSSHSIRETAIRAGGNGAGISRFAISSWFDEIYTLYPASDGSGSPAFPSMVPSGSIGFVMMHNIPFLVMQIDGAMPAEEVERGLKEYRKGLHGPSAWGGKTPAITRVLYGKQEIDGDYIVFVVHNEWEDKLVRARRGDVKWTAIQ